MKPHDTRIVILSQDIDLSGHSQKGGVRCCYLIYSLLRQQGYDVTVWDMNACKIQGGRLFYQGVEQLPSAFHGVIRRTWGGGDSSFKGLEVQKYLVEHGGAYPENPYEAQCISLNKLAMQYCIESQAPAHAIFSFHYASTPQKRNDDIAAITDHLAILKDRAQKKGMNLEYDPVAVLKNNHGAQGKGIAMIFAKDLAVAAESIARDVRAGKSFVLQEYCKPVRFFDPPSSSPYDGTFVPCASHIRVHIARDIQTPDPHGSHYVIKGLLYIQRDGSYISNTSHTEGILQTSGPIHDTRWVSLLKSVEESLSKMAGAMHANQLGCDVLVEERGEAHPHYAILEGNDCQGLSGPILEAQKIPQQFVAHYTTRLTAHLQQPSLDHSQTVASPGSPVVQPMDMLAPERAGQGVPQPSTASVMFESALHHRTPPSTHQPDILELVPCLVRSGDATKHMAI